MRTDSHVHVVGPLDRYPQALERTWTAAPADLDTLRQLAASRDVERFVIVQPSFYGDDNSMLTDSLDALEGLGRGVAVIDPWSITEDEMTRLSGAGVCGARMNLYSESAIAQGGGRTLEALFGAAMPRCEAHHWHIEVIAPIAVLREYSSLLASSKVPVVIDHYGLYGDTHPDDTDGESLLELLRNDHVWMKLSAPYRSGWSELETRPNPGWMHELLSVSTERMVWGSDWPHTPVRDPSAPASSSAPYRPLDYAEMFDNFLAAVNDKAVAEQILSDNPARLYGFPAA